MTQTERAKFGTKLGIILATAGSAVGLGNVWRFPYLTGENGGAAFILIYIGCVLMLGIPCMIGEFIVGRHAQSNTARAFRKLGGRTPLALVGYMGVFTGLLITGYYAVVAGWCLHYIYAAAMGHLSSATNPEETAAYFAAFEQDPLKPILWAVVILVITHLIIVRGIRGGIEKASKLMMPALFVLLLIIVLASCMLPGAGRGIAFLLQPDFGKVTGGVVLDAMGQAFYSLSIGMGCICTYASYFSRETHLGRSAVQISLLDTLVAILSGLMIFPAAFSVGMQPDQGPSLIFVTLPLVFSKAFAAVPIVGYVVSLLFYALLALAALTSLISLHEVGTAFVQEEMRTSRPRAATGMTVACIVLAIFSSLSLGCWDELKLFGMSLFSLFDFTSGQILLPLGGLLTSLLVGWYMPRRIVRDEFTGWGTQAVRYYPVFLALVRFVCPVCIVLIFLNQFGVI